ncbi:helix-turn-helix domain-containing protein [Pseudomonas syringae group genomosp. 3]|uniref:helix-turn-helix domain-containing protein n=1 Tax=Pseudomonas syringae group genomosp. 3 TaxID=251701 RepID=UPI0001E29CA4|nr:helix-turn-helix transcriptional regulator [Pseudomonas syringae group genomosp. 3]
MDIYELRIKALRRAMAGLNQKDFANQHGLDASYLSQLLNGHRKLGEKAARTLETKADLPAGYLVSPATEALASIGSGATEPPVAASRAIPAVVSVISKAIADGRLSSDDAEELRRMAIHLIKKNEASPSSVTAIPARFSGLSEAVFAGAEAGENVDDMLKMIEHGMKKSQPKDSAKPNEVVKKKRSN